MQHWRHLGVVTAMIALSLSWSACSNPVSSSNTVSISGVIEPHQNWAPVLYLLRPLSFQNLLASYQMPIVDSLELGEDGSFQWTRALTPEEEGLYVLMTQKRYNKYKNEIESLPMEENYVLVSLEQGVQIELRAKAERLTHSHSFLKANDETRLLAQLHNFRQPLVQEIERQYKENTDPTGFSWNVHGNEEIAHAINAGLEGFIQTAQSPIPLFAALRLRSPDNEYRDHPEFFLELSRRLNASFPDHPWTREFASLLSPEKLPLLKGERMPEFSLPTPQGDTLRMDHVKGKLILVDFWASWCAPCRKEARQVIRPLYEEYSDEGFEVLGISIDSDRDSWLKAIQKDGANWLHASDLMGDASPVRQSLRFETIPSCYILDEEGRLLARNLHGEELKKFLENYFRG